MVFEFTDELDPLSSIPVTALVEVIPPACDKSWMVFPLMVFDPLVVAIPLTVPRVALVVRLDRLAMVLLVILTEPEQAEYIP